MIEIINYLKQFANRFHIDIGCVDIVEQKDGEVQIHFKKGTFPLVPKDTFIDNLAISSSSTTGYDTKEEEENVMKWNLKVKFRIKK